MDWGRLAPCRHSFEASRAPKLAAAPLFLKLGPPACYLPAPCAKAGRGLQPRSTLAETANFAGVMPSASGQAADDTWNAYQAWNEQALASEGSQPPEVSLCGIVLGAACTRGGGKPDMQVGHMCGTCSLFHAVT